MPSRTLAGRGIRNRRGSSNKSPRAIPSRHDRAMRPGVQRTVASRATPSSCSVSPDRGDNPARKSGAKRRVAQRRPKIACSRGLGDWEEPAVMVVCNKSNSA
jgi:hypothetical protein